MIERMEEGIKRRTLAAAGLAIAALAIAMPVLNPDIYWHLSAGRWMTLHRALPSADFLSWTERGAPWTDFEWLSQLAFYAAWSAAGKAGLFALKLAVLGASFLPFIGLLRLYGLASAGWWALPLWGLALLPNSDVRPENFSVLFFALLLWRLEKSRVSGRAWPSGAAGFAGLAAFFAVWANLHAGFAYGILLLLTYAAGAAADRRSGGTLSTWPPLFAAFAAAAGALVNPWGWRIYSVLIEHSADAASLSRWLAEWMAPRLSNPLHWPFFAMAAACAALMAWRWARLRRPPAAHLAALCWLGFGAFSHSRHLVFFCMAALAFSLDSAAAVYGAERTARAGRALLAAALLYLAAAVWPRYLAFGVNIGEEAAGAADYLRANAAALGGRRLYNPWNWGGYLGWALPPEYPVYVDGRYLFHKYLPRVSAAMEDQNSWAAFAGQNGFELALFRRDGASVALTQPGPGGVPVELRRPAYLVFMPKKDWALLYWDRWSLLFARRGRPLPPEFAVLRPGDFDAVKLALCAGQLKKEDLAAELARYAALPGRPSSESRGLAGWLGSFPDSCLAR